jgi:two-component system chemotaxis sensor kinase CheA
VTSLEAREHRERGLQAGADAYIAKSGFDQGQLLDTVGRLL